MICGKHWRLVDRARRRVYGHHLRRWRRYGAAAYGPPAVGTGRRLTGQAVERAMWVE